VVQSTLHVAWDCRIGLIHYVARWCKRRPEPRFSFVTFSFAYISSFCHAMLCISAAYAVMRCLSVRLSVTFVISVKTSNRILRLFSSSSSQTILVFAYQTLWWYSDGDPVNGGIECRGVWKKLRFSTNISLYLPNDTR